MLLWDRVRYRYRASKYRRKQDPAEIRYVQAHVSTGDVVLDVGAHKGAYLYWLRRGVGATGRVVAFEPQPTLTKYLWSVVEFMGWTNVDVRGEGVGATPGEFQLVIPGKPGDTSPGASFIAHERFEESTTVAVPVTTLDSVASELSQPPSFLKVDVEGLEADVFRGGEDLLTSEHPTLLFECESRHQQGESIERVFDLLADFGYEGRFFDAQDLLPVTKFDAEVHQAEGLERFWEVDGYCNNFVFTRSRKQAKVRAA